MPSLRLTLACYSLLMITSNSSAAEMSIDPTLNMQLILDDNIRLSADRELQVAGTSVRAGFNAAYRSPKLTITLDPKLQSTRYSEEVGLEGDNYYTDAAIQYAHSPSLSLALDTSFRDEAIGVEEVNVLGSSFSETRKEALSATPAISYRLAENLNLQLSYIVQDVNFDEAESTALNDFDYQQITFSSNYIISDQTALTATFYRSVFTVPETGFETTNKAFQFGLDYNFSPTLSMTLSAGIIKSDIEFLVATLFGPAIGTESISGELIDFSLSKTYETVELDVGYERSVTPGAVGEQNLRDDFRFNLGKRFSDKFSGTLNLNYYENRSQSQIVNLNNQFNFLQFGASLNYRFERNFNIVGRYYYREVENIVTNEKADSNSVSLELNYDFDTMTVSR